VRSIVTNPVYLGWWLVEGQVVHTDNHPAIIQVPGTQADNAWFQAHYATATHEEQQARFPHRAQMTIFGSRRNGWG
jgi:hypothetical protein